MKPAIRIKNIAKLYRLGEQHHSTIGDKLAAMFKRGSLGTKTSKQPEEIWALKDVTFDVAPGEVVGIIGRNGAGKSTLLKILSRITEPTSGEVELHGRVSSLLEVGTGFHPELTGRDNVYLNGSVLGMKKAEIDRKFDEIVDFSGVEKFLDTPVKHYSSGMQVRLAFAVAAHLEPEILIVDEVLAVGDAEFQRKCIGKMNDVAESGRTVLFVSHNMAAVERLCSRCVLLEHGGVKATGPVAATINQYFSCQSNTIEWCRTKRMTEKNNAWFSRISISGEEPRAAVTTASKLTVEIECIVAKAVPNLKLAIRVDDAHGEELFSTSPVDTGGTFPLEVGHHRYSIQLPPHLFLARRYSITAALYDVGPIERIDRALDFDVEYRSSPSNAVDTNRPGKIYLALDWTHSVNQSSGDREFVGTPD